MKKRLQAAEMTFMKKTAGFTLLDHKRNEEIVKKKRTRKLNQSLKSLRIIVPIGRVTLKEWILTESQTNFCTTDYMEKEA
jgi:hypothetical protein